MLLKSDITQQQQEWSGPYKGAITEEELMPQKAVFGSMKWQSKSGPCIEFVTWVSMFTEIHL